MPDTKQCPFCGETILAVAIKCKHCREFLDPGESSGGLGPSADDVPDVLPDEPLYSGGTFRKLYTWFVLGHGISTVFVLTGAAILVASFAVTDIRAYNARFQLWLIAGIGTIVCGVLPSLVGSVMLFMMLYKSWKLIQDGHARTDPFKAVALMFVPYFNFYWMFVAIRGLALDMNAYIKRHGLAVRPASVRVATGYCIMTIVGAVPFLGLLAFIVLQCWLVFLLGGTIAKTAGAIADAPSGVPMRRRSGVPLAYAAVAFLGLLIVTGLSAGLYFTWPKDAARSFSIPGEPASVVSVSADGRWIATESAAMSPRQVKIWSRSVDGTLAKKPVLTVSVSRLFVMATSFSPDGKFLAVVAQDNDHPANCMGPGDLTILQVATGRKCLTVLGSPGQDGALDCVAFSRDGTMIATAFVDQTVLTARSKRLLRIRKVATGEVVQTLEGHANGVSSLAFSPDGTRLASGSQDGTVKLWDIDSGALLYSIAAPQGFPHHIEFSPDGKMIAACDSLGVRIWTADTGAVILSVTDFDASDCVAFSPDSRYLASGGEDVKIWDVASQTAVQKLRRGLIPSTDHLESIAFSADGKTLLASSGDELIVWEVKFDKGVGSSHP